MNINTIIISTTLSFVFAVHSFYGFIKYIKQLDYLEEEMETIYELKNSYNDLNNKYNRLQENYDLLTVENHLLKTSLSELSSKMVVLERKKIALMNCVGETPLEDVMKDILEDNKLTCHTGSSDNPKINIEIINLFRNSNDEPEQEQEQADAVVDAYISDSSGAPIDIDGEDNPSIYNSLLDHGFEVLEQPLLESNDLNEHVVKSRIRGTSITEIDWTEATRRFLFG